jgi:general secretion pathway protein D
MPLWLHSTQERATCAAAEDGEPAFLAPAESMRRVRGVRGSRFTAMARSLGLASTLALLAANSALAQLTPNFRDTDIRQVIEVANTVTGRTFLIDPRVRAQVTLISSTQMSADAFYQAFLATLAVHGYAAVDEGGVTKIIPDANVRQYADNEPLGAGEGDEFVTQVVKLENVGAAQLVPILRPLMPQYAQLAAHQQSNMLVIADRASNVDRILAIVHAMDRGANEEVEVIRLENASAAEIVRMLTQLGRTPHAGNYEKPHHLLPQLGTSRVLRSRTAHARLA